MLEIRKASPDERAAIEQLYAAAFPDEDLIPLIRDLAGLGDEVVFLTARRDGALVGHIALTKARVAATPVALLAPLAVAPDHQRTGVGSALIRAGFDAMAKHGMAAVCTLGDPAYYGRFGFKPERFIIPPYELPEDWGDAWQSVRLGDEPPLCEGRIHLPSPWMHRGLWTP